MVNKENALLPRAEELQLILTSPWEYSLNNLIENYFQYSNTTEDNIWPVQKIQSPTIILSDNIDLKKKAQKHLK